MSKNRFYSDIWVHENTIHDAFASAINGASNVLAIANKGYVDDSFEYVSSLLDDGNVNILPLQKIDDKTILENKTLNQIFDALFFPIVKYPYVLPNIQDGTDVVFKRVSDDSIITDDDIIEIGTQIYLSSTILVDYNNSAGFDGAEYLVETFASALIATDTSLTSNFDTVQFTSRKNQRGRISTDYLAAVSENDSHGNIDIVGDPPIYGAGTLTTEWTNLVTYWSKFVSVYLDSVTPVITNGSTARTELSAAEFFSSIVDINEEHIDVEISYNIVNAIQHIIVGLPNIGNFATRKVVFTIDGEDITSFATEQVVTGVNDASGSTTTQEYTFYIIDLELSITDDFVLKIKSNNQI